MENKVEFMMKTRYNPVDDGYQIIGSKEIFNRALYGGHSQDNLTERYFTFAGDLPIVMGAITDWKKSAACLHAKCGVFMAGVALTPGLHIPMFYSRGEKGGDRTSQWFHQSEGTVTTFRNGCMEYEIRPYFQCGPKVKAFLQILPIQSEDGFLVRFNVETDQRINLVIAFGGITNFLSSFNYPFVEARNFHPDNCKGNTIFIGNNRASITGAKDNLVNTVMRIGSSFPVNLSIGDARNIEKPGLFLGNVTEPIQTPMVRMDCAIEPGKIVDGFVVVLRNTEESALTRLLSSNSPVDDLKREIRKKQSAIEVTTPDDMLNLTVPPNVIAMDACWHHNVFCHGAYSWHTPYMGWRNWYGPTVIAWHDRVQTAFHTHASTQVRKSNGQEEFIYPGPNQYSQLKNSYGFIPEIPDGRKKIFYNMQEVGVDMILHNIEWTGNLKYAEEVFDVISNVLDWEERILDPDNDGLYQNWLNTWISDAHSYNGGGCAQSSAYNFMANKMMAKLASLLGKNPKLFSARAEKIKKACQDILWLPEKGVMAEYIDTIGNKLIHPSPELATIYHSIEMGIVDHFQVYQMLRFTEATLRNERTIARNGRLVWSSDWYPQNYSSCGLYTAENIHLAWAYFICGQEAKGNEILKAIADAHFLGRSPGLAAHCMTESGYTDGAPDFSEISSMYLRLIVEGLFGIRFHLLDGYIEIAPNFPADWDHARLKTKDISLRYKRTHYIEALRITSHLQAKRVIRLPIRSTRIQEVSLNGSPVEYRIEEGIGFSSIVVETGQSEDAALKVIHSNEPLPSLEYPMHIFEGDSVSIRVNNGSIIEIKDPSGCLSQIEHDDRILHAVVKRQSGGHTIFIRVKKDQWDGWLPADVIIKKRTVIKKSQTNVSGNYSPVDISRFFNVSLTDIHKLEYWNPRPKGYSIMTRLNGRFGWDWNQKGFNKVEVDDSSMRSCGGTYRVPSDIPFIAPETGKNAACVSIWENFPEETVFPLSGKGTELAVFFVGITNPMQSRVENGKFTVEYQDGKKEEVSLINPINFDDWLNAALQKENETVYFNDYNHGIVQRIVLDPLKELRSFTGRAIANEVIIGILGITVRRMVIS